jgi:spastic paraplegia protein 7
VPGLRAFHTGLPRQRGEKQDDGDDKDEDKDTDDDDERDRMLSALKTAVGFLAVPLLLMLVFGGLGGGGGDNVNSLEQASGNQQRSGQPVAEIQWVDFYQNLLMRGEVQEIVVHAGVNRATAVLYPGAVYQGQKVNTQVVRIVTANVDNIETKLREAEAKMGIKSGDMISITYERKSEDMGRLMAWILIGGMALLAIRGLTSASKNMRATMKSSNPFTKMTKADFTLIDPMIRKGKGTKFSDVAGLMEPKVELLEFVDCLKNPEKYRELGAKPTRGALLFGPPGCGKTMLAKAVANEANVPFLSMNGSEFIEMIGGLGASRVRSLFAEARKRAPSIIYIDEIDAIGKQRESGASMGGGGGEQEQTLNQLLVEMDGMSSSSDVILLASTNRSEVLDKALLRPGRFNRHITIDLPTMIERREILEKHLSTVVLEEPLTVYSERLATLTPGFSGADLANLVNESALHAAREAQDMIKLSNLEYAHERVTAGPEKKSSVLAPGERRVVAYHESGHALVGWMLEHTDALLKVTILPRTSAALGFAQYTPSDQKLFSPEQLMDRMCMALGGRVAESLTFNRITTGAQNDLEKVTKMAYAQVREFGFSAAVGHVSFQQQEGVKPYSKKLQATMDLEAKQMIAEAYKRTEVCLKENHEKLEALAQLLLERETLNYPEVEALLGPPPHGKKHLVTPLVTGLACIPSD